MFVRSRRIVLLVLVDLQYTFSAGFIDTPVGGDKFYKWVIESLIEPI